MIVPIHNENKKIIIRGMINEDTIGGLTGFIITKNRTKKLTTRDTITMNNEVYIDKIVPNPKYLF